MKVRLSGMAMAAIRDGGFGLNENEPELDRQVRAKLETTRGTKVGFGWRYIVELSTDEAITLRESVELQSEALALGARDNPDDSTLRSEVHALRELARFLGLHIRRGY
jgi:hypothetical protein